VGGLIEYTKGVFYRHTVVLKCKIDERTPTKAPPADLENLTFCSNDVGAQGESLARGGWLLSNAGTVNWN
jgi:hypothetical protein